MLIMMGNKIPPAVQQIELCFTFASTNDNKSSRAKHFLTISRFRKLMGRAQQMEPSRVPEQKRQQLDAAQLASHY